MRPPPTCALLFAVAAALGGATARSQAPAPIDPMPASLEEFETAAARIVEESGVPGAGLALVGADGILWEGGVGVADLERRIPVTADTRFMAGSISKSFVGLALVQLAEEGLIDLTQPVGEVLPEVAIDNPWDASDPVEVIHLLQHTAGFDDMRFRDTYITDGSPDLPLLEVLARSPDSRRVRWRPGTRMSYSNHGYAVAGAVIEKISGQTFEDFIEERILVPVGMHRSGFRRSGEDEADMARGYRAGSTTALPLPRVHLRPAGGFHTTAHDLGRFIWMLLQWGEIGPSFVVDPEYQSNMEHPRTSLAFRAGLRYGYGSGIYWFTDTPYAMLGHGGNIAGFTAAYAYSPARDAGVVVLLNQSGARTALHRLLTLGIRYLKRDVEPSVAAPVELPHAALAAHEGYYHDANPRNQAFAFLDWLGSGRTIRVVDGTLRVEPLRGDPTTLLPVSDRLFRTESQILPTLVFADDDDGRRVLTGVTGSGATGVYAERVSRWRVELVRVPVLLSAAVLLTPILALAGWVVHAGRARPRGFWGLKTVLLTLPLSAAAVAAAARSTPVSEWGTLNAATATWFLATLAVPVASATSAVLAIGAAAQGASRALVTYALVCALAGAAISAFLWSWGVLGLRAWTY
ncbi:MAG: serine hydrolase domain-containing protein [Acidobacteriota bacterium]